MAKDIMAIIPARGNSKGIPRKNMYLLNGKPLLYWTIKVACEANIFSKIIVSSEDKEILTYAKECNVFAFQRPSNLSQDHIASSDVVCDVLKRLKNDNLTKYFMLLQPTSPLRTSEHIKDAYKQFLNNKAKSLISGYVPSKHPLKSFLLNQKGYLDSIVPGISPCIARQTLQPAFYQNGAIYINDTEEFLKTKSILTDSAMPYYMRIENSIDIDTIDDMKNVEKIMKDNKL